MKSLACLSAAVALLCSDPGLAQDFQSPLVDGRVNVVDDEMKPLFLRKQPFFPGETVELKIEYRVDAMRWMHEDRECWSKWFGGIDCHYVKRSDSSGLDAARVPLILDLVRPDGGDPPPRVTPSLANGGDYDSHRQFPIGTTQFTLTITLPQLEAAINEDYYLQGRVAPLYGAPGSLSALVRRACEPFRNKEHCSQGEYVIKIDKVDAKARFDMILSWLSKARGAAEISQAIDDWTIFKLEGGKLIANTANRVELAKQLLIQVNNFHPIPSGGAPRPDRLEILTLARRLDGNNPSISSAIVATQVANGDISAAQTTNNEMIAKYQQQYKAGSDTEPVMRGYAEALRDAGHIYLERSYHLNPADALVAVDYFKQSAQVWAKYIEKVTGADVGLGTNQYVNVRLDEARAGARVSDLIPLDSGVDAVRDARTRLPLTREGMVIGVESDGAMLVATDRFTALTQIGADKLPLTMLPAETLEVLDTDPLKGRALLRERGQAGIVVLGIQNGISRSLTRELKNPKLSLGGIVGVDASSLIRQADGKETTLSTLPSDTYWAAARDKDTVVTLAGGGKTPPLLISATPPKALPQLELDSVAGLVLSRDGTFLAVEGSATDKRVIFLIDTANSKILQTLKRETTDPSERLMFTANGQYLIASRQNQSMEIVNVQTGTIASLQDSDARRAPVPLNGNRLLLAHGAVADPIRYISIVEADKVTTGPINAQPEDVVTRAELNQELRNPTLVALFRVADAPLPTLAGTTLGTANSPVMVRLNSATGARGSDIPLFDWHPLRSFPVGTQIAVNPGATGGQARLYPPDGSNPISFPAAVGMMTRIIPIGPGAGFAVLTETPQGSVTRAQIYSAPKSQVDSIDLDQHAGRSWKALSLTTGPMIARQQELTLIEVPNTPPASAVPSPLLKIAADGTKDLATLTIEAPHQIVAVLDSGATIVRRTPDKLILETKAGAPIDLADCTSKPSCTFSLYQTAPTTLVSALEMVDKLELNEWTIGPSITSKGCKACSQFDPGAATAALASRPIGFPSTRFTLSPGSSGIYIAFPGNRSLFSGSFGDEQLGSRTASGMPVYSNQDRIAAQAGSNIELWKRLKL